MLFRNDRKRALEMIAHAAQIERVCEDLGLESHIYVVIDAASRRDTVSMDIFDDNIKQVLSAFSLAFNKPDYVIARLRDDPVAKQMHLTEYREKILPELQSGKYDYLLDKLKKL
jgi:hypothetical protein